MWQAIAGGGAAGPDNTFRTITGFVTLDGTAKVYISSGVANATLPLAGSCPGRIYEFIVPTSTNLTLTRAGSDTIQTTTGTPTNSYGITPNTRITFVSDGISKWYMLSGDPAFPGGNAGGSLNGTYPNPGLAGNSVNASQITNGAVLPPKLGGVVPVAGDAGKLIQLDISNPTTQFKISPAAIDSVGNFTVTGNVILGPTALVTQLVALNTVYEPRVNAPFAAQDTTKAGWAVSHYIDASDAVVWWHRTAGAAANSGAEFMRLRGSDGKLVCTLADAIVQRAMLAGGAAANGPGIVLATGVKAFNSGSTYNTWILVETLPNITTRGGPVLLVANHGLSHVSLTTTAAAMSFRWLRSGATIYNDFGTKAGQTGYLPLPSSLQLDVPPAGTYSYTFWVYLASGASSSLINDSGFNRLYQAIEIG